QEQASQAAPQICRSLREAHARGIIHRDLKPANVMLRRQHDDHDLVKVLDFGLVKFFHGDNPDGEITNAGTFMGSPHYIAPEQARNQSPDQRCDLYSLGVLLYQMLTGKVPFTAVSPVDIILKHLHEAPVPPTAEGRSRAVRPPPLPGDALEERARWHRFTGMGGPPASVRSIWLTTGAAVLAAAALAVWMGGARRQRPKPTVTVEHTARV